MASCELSGKKTRAKNLVSHSNIKTKSRSFANIQSKKFFSNHLKKFFQFKVATQIVRQIDKWGSFDTFIMKQKDEVLSTKALKVKKQILKKTKRNKKEVVHEKKN
ncbi:MAG: 50S ribosomal protein L28 [Bdellovibrionales bacterium]|nr:50S ribosomal protein L28 [Bdellovibrionales bacterium]